MSTLIEKIEKAFSDTANLIKGNPAITDVWYDFRDTDMDELREASKKYTVELTYSIEFKRMLLHISVSQNTIFCFSKIMKVTEHFVEDDVAENV